MNFLRTTFIVSALSISLMETIAHASADIIPQADSKIFGYNGAGYTGCAVTLHPEEGSKPAWYGLSLDPVDLDFYINLRANPEVMGLFGDGKTVTPEATDQRFNQWQKRFSDGNPHGALTVISINDEPARAGYVIAGGGDRPGA